jgi:thioredoxin-dependent peroxiredoxin
MTPLKKGDAAPNFSAKDQDGNTHNLSDYKGKKLVVFFYPKANALLGVSADNAKAQGNFKNKFDFPFPLLADEDKAVIEAFGVWGPKKFMGKEYDGIHRTTFIIDENGIIDEVISDVKTKAHASQILK